MIVRPWKDLESKPTLCVCGQEGVVGGVFLILLASLLPYTNKTKPTPRSGLLPHSLVIGHYRDQSMCSLTLKGP